MTELYQQRKPPLKRAQIEDNMKVIVQYPLQEGRIVLRTELDWQQSILGKRIKNHCYQFTLETDRPFLYYKPCLELGDQLYWSLGHNNLATRASHLNQTTPAFFYPGGTISLKPEKYQFEGREYLIRVYHPPGYHENPYARYPVIYMHDGHNLFFPHEAFAGVTWKVDSTLELLDSMSSVEKCIVVALYPQDRMTDYTRPGYQHHGRFLIEHLMPTLEQELNCLKGPLNTAVFGSSLGGVASFYLAWQYPQVFGMAACLSSTFGWQDDLFQRVASEKRPAVCFYLDSGWPGDNYEVTRNMTALLLSRGAVWGRDLLSVTYPLERHNEGAWATRLHLPIQYFFGIESRLALRKPGPRSKTN